MNDRRPLALFATAALLALISWLWLRGDRADAPARTDAEPPAAQVLAASPPAPPPAPEGPPPPTVQADAAPPEPEDPFRVRGCAHPDIVGRGYRLRVSGPDGVTSLYTGRATAAGLELDNGKFEAEGIVVIDGFREAHIAWQLDADGAVQRCELSELEPSALDKRVRLVGPDGSTPNYTRLNACGMTADVHEDGTVAIGELPSDCSGGNITWPAGARVQGIVDLSIEDLEGLADGATLELHPNRVQLEMRAPTLDLSGLLLSAEHTEAGLQFDSSLDEPTDLPELLQPTLITHIDNVAVGEMSGAELLDAAARMMAGAPYTTAPHPSSP